MTSPREVAAFHSDYDKHTDHRIHLFGALLELVPSEALALYPGSYVDIAPSVWFDDVVYVDIDKRTPRFFGEADDVADLVRTKRRAHNASNTRTPSISFHHLDYSTDLPIELGSVDLLISLYAGFISEHCTKYLRKGGLLLCNNSHGDASLASLDPTLKLVAVMNCRDAKYSVSTNDLDSYLHPKRRTEPTAEELHALQRGIGYTRTPNLYIFRVDEEAVPR